MLAHWLTLRGEDVLWTIPVELHFYLLFPAVWLLFTRSQLCFGLVSISLILLAFLRLASIAEFDLKFATVLPYFLGGALLSVMRLRSGNKWSDAPFAISLICLFLLYPRLWTSEPNIKVVQLAMWASPLYFHRHPLRGRSEHLVATLGIGFREQADAFPRSDFLFSVSPAYACHHSFASIHGNTKLAFSFFYCDLFHYANCQHS